MPDAAPDPVPTSAAVAEIVTFVPWVKLDPVTGCVIETVGAAVSIRTSCDLTASAFPAMSREKNFTVAVWDTVNDPEYRAAVALVVGSLPSVV